MEAITATYEEHDDDWSVTVAGMGQELTERAPGIIAARDQAEQLVDSLKSEDGEVAVVHLLHGSALEFTTAYMTARLARTGGSGAGPAIPEQAGGAQEATQSPPRGESAEPASTAEQEGADTVESETVGHTETARDSAQELAK